LVGGAWLLAAFFSIPMLFLYEEKLIQGSPQCWIDLGSPEAWRWYMCLVSVCLFVGPALIISACYAIIVKTIWANGSIFLPTGNITFSKCLISTLLLLSKSLHYSCRTGSHTCKAGQFKGHHSAGKGQNGQDDTDHRICFHHLLVAVHHL